MSYPPPFAAQLEAAIDAAVAAGEMLRDAFNEPGGAEAAGGASIDYEAERLILQRLSGAFPHYGFRGEESGLVRAPGVDLPADEMPRSWLVDPNEGTTAWLAGRRGAAVSIALLEGVKPVLGVVHAFNAPDDRGDTIAWARGGPLLRNGEPVRRAWPATAGSHEIAMLPPTACDAAEQTARLAAPLRFLCVPGVAYRLALTAVGDGDGALVTAGAMAADLAAGHALIEAAGGVMIDKWGEPLRYTRDLDVSTRSDVFAGAPAVVDRMRDLDWSHLDEPRSREPGLVPGRGPVESGRLSRAQGCLMGQLCGDALGSQVEFMTAEEIAALPAAHTTELLGGGPHGIIPGQPTDDSEMALLLARTLVDAPRYDAEAAWKAYESWLLSRPFDLGRTITEALTGTPNAESQANGALMRIAPVGIYAAARDPRQGALWAREDAALTHPHPVCGDVNALFTAAVALAVADGPSPADLYDRIVGWCAEWTVDAEVAATVARSRDEAPAEYQRQMGWVQIAFGNALWQLLHAPSLEAALVDTVRRGGDTDTNAAICGALLGAVHGLGAVPRRWRRVVLSCRASRDALAVKHPRPHTMWPCGALGLAEALLVSGRGTTG